MVLLGKKLGLWKKARVTFYGPVMMLRTGKGRSFIEKASTHTNFWITFGTLSTAVTLLFMILATIFLAWQAFRTISEPLTIESPVDADFDLLGINPVLTLIYAVIGFTVAIVIHEFTHGALAVAVRIRLESLGFLLFVIPVGAFVEPDEKELKAAARANRMRVYSAGPASNILTAAVCLGLLIGMLGPAAKPVFDGAVATAVTPDSPAAIFGIHPWTEVTSVDGTPVANASQFKDYVFENPGDPIVLEIVYKSQRSTIALPGGIVVTEVFDGPAYNAGIKPGMIIASMNNETINTADELRTVIENSTRDAAVSLTVLKHGFDRERGIEWFVEDSSIRAVNLTSKWIYYYTHYPNENSEAYRNISFMALSTAPLGAEFKDPESFSNIIGRPFSSNAGKPDVIVSGIEYLALPFKGYSPVLSPAADLYKPSGILCWVPVNVYWTAMNLAYWIFWVNLMVGLTNALPALPMDGGYLLKDSLRALAHRRGLRLTGLDRAIGRHPMTDEHVDMIVIASTVFILGLATYLVLWQVVGSTA